MNIPRSPRPQRSLGSLVCISLLWLQRLLADPFGDALGQPTLVWTSSGNLPWFVETTVTHDGVSAVRSGAIGDSQFSIVFITGNPTDASGWSSVSLPTTTVGGLKTLTVPVSSMNERQFSIRAISN